MASRPKKPGMSGIPDPSLPWDHRKPEAVDLEGKRLVVVGGTGGLGRAIAVLAASRGASVTVVGQTFRDGGRKGIDFLGADLASMKEARRVAASFADGSIDVLVLTTGIFAGPKREVTAEGLERDMAVSYLSRLVLLRELGPRLGKSRPTGAMRPRVFVMGFPGTGEAGTLGDLNAERKYEPFPVHMNTVAGNEALVLDGAKRHPELGVFGLNPGLIKTNIRANVLGGEGSLRMRFVEWMIGLFTPTAETYAARIVPLLVAPELEGRTGAMFNQKANAILPSAVLDEARVTQLLAESDALVARVA